MPKNQDNILKNCLELCKRALAYNFIFSFIINILILQTSLYSLQILDRVISSGSIETLVALSVIMIVVYIILSIIQIGRSIIFIQIANWLDKELSPILQELSIDYKNKNKGSQNMEDLTVIKSFITDRPLTYIFDAPWSIIYFVVIFYIHWINGIIIMIGALVLFLLAMLNEKLTKSLIEKSNKIHKGNVRNIEFASRNSEVIKAMGMSKNILNYWKKSYNQLQNTSTRRMVRTETMASITKSFRLFIQMCVMGMGAFLVISNRMSAGGIIATSILSGKALMPFDNAIIMYKSIILAWQSYGRLIESLDNHQQKKNMDLPAPQGNILIEKLAFKPSNKGNFAVKINLKIDAGQIIGVIGPSGGGKTTLARLMLGILTSNSGKVRLDGADISLLDSNKIGSHIGYLPQDIELFAGTIKDNIARMDHNADSVKIVEAAKFTNTHDLILSLPEGYDTLLSEIEISGGQKQRVALTRAFYDMPKLVILDEPNSNLDIQGEQALIQTIKNAKKRNITLIIISHRPSILQFVDKILMLQDGVVKIFDESKKVIAKLSSGSK